MTHSPGKNLLLWTNNLYHTGSKYSVDIFIIYLVTKSESNLEQKEFFLLTTFRRTIWIWHLIQVVYLTLNITPPSHISLNRILCPSERADVKNTFGVNKVEALLQLYTLNEINPKKYRTIYMQAKNEFSLHIFCDFLNLNHPIRLNM